MARSFQLLSALPVNLADPVNRAHPLNRGRVAWWLALPGWYGAPKFHDLFGRYSGTLSGMTTAGSGWGSTFRPGGFAQVNFDGTDDYVACPAVLSGSPAGITIAGWMSRSSSGHLNMIGWGDTNGNRFNILAFNDGAIYCQVENGGTLFPSIASSYTGWHYFMLAWDTNASYLYVDGVFNNLVGSSFSPTYTVTGVFSIGAEPANGRYSQGAHDSVSIWSRTLSADEALAVYNNEIRGYPGTLNRLDAALWMVPPVVTAVKVRRTLYGRAGSRSVA